MLQRESVNDAWDLPKEETMQVFLERHPEWADHAKIERPFEWKWYYAFQQVGDLKTEKIIPSLSARPIETGSSGQLFGCINPSGFTGTLVAGISANGHQIKRVL